MDSPVLVQRDGFIETWTINRPAQSNPISGMEVVDALVACVEAVNADYGVRAVIVTGAGSTFSAGGNVKDMANRRGLFGGEASRTAGWLQSWDTTDSADHVQLRRTSHRSSERSCNRCRMRPRPHVRPSHCQQ